MFLKCFKCNRNSICKARKKGDLITCDDCLRIFANKYCLKRHKLPDKKTNKSICELYYICKICLKFVDLNAMKAKNINQHNCNLMYCNICCQYYMNGQENIHFCSILPYKEKPLTKEFFF